MSKPLLQSTGRRKEAVARVRFRPGDGKITVNKKPLEVYFPSGTYRDRIVAPLLTVSKRNDFDVDATVDGGGISGQAGALALAIARGLADLDEDLHKLLRRKGMLTRDARVKERKKYGLKKARKAPQYSKR
jgi:small subunit ribosomal protein S9